MVLKVLVIGDIGNYFQTIRKYVKKSKIHIINFPKDGFGEFTYDDDYELFENYKVSEQVKKINSIKNKFDVCVVMGTGERIAYLSNLNYVCYYVGRDIDAPRFIKNSKEEWYDEPLHKLNFLERQFYKNTFNFAKFHVAPTWVFEHLKKYSKSGIKMDLKPIDFSMFKKDLEKLERKKEKFTFFCPQRIGYGKGTNLLWKALEYCKTEFEILQVDWRDNTTKEEDSKSSQLRENLPKQVKIIPMIKRNEIPKYYDWCDAVIGNLKIGSFENVELEGALSKKPVISFVDNKIKIIIDKTELNSPFLLEKNDPEYIAEFLDRIVLEKELREDLAIDGYEFARKIADPEKSAEWWESFLEKVKKENNSICNNSSQISVKMRMWLYLIGNRLYTKKIKKLLSN